MLKREELLKSWVISFPEVGFDCHEFTVRKMYYRKKKALMARKAKEKEGEIGGGKRECLKGEESGKGDLKRLKFN